jgi:thymidylate synthase
VSPTGFIGVITFWTKQEEVYKAITASNLWKVIIIGNLYTTDGIEYIIKNAYLCPQLTYLIFTGYDRNGVYNSFFDFTANSIPEEFLNKFRNHFRQNSSRVILESINTAIESLENTSLKWIDSIHEFPEEVISRDRYQSEHIGFLIRDSNLRRLWRRVLTKINMFGCLKESDNDATQKELLGVCSVLTSDTACLTNDMPNYGMRNEYLKQFIDDAGDCKFEYTYGSRLFGLNQIDNIVDELSTREYSRRAIALTWRLETDNKSKNPPCLVLIDCKIQESKLFMTCYFRSQDMYNAFCLNVFGLKELQRIICAHIGKCSCGHIMLISNSAHVYQKDFNKINELNELDCNLDPRGHFLISIREKKIYIQHFSDKKDFEFESDDVSQIISKVQPFVSEVSHGLYLGRELERAYNCIVYKKKYSQD